MGRLENRANKANNTNKTAVGQSPERVRAHIGLPEESPSRDYASDTLARAASRDFQRKTP